MSGRGKYIVAVFIVLLSLAAKAQGDKRLSELPVKVLISADAKGFIIYVTGDGGWNNFSQDLCHNLVKSNYNVLVFDSRKYFWSAKQPDTFARDITLLANHYLKEWNKKEFALVGYSFGADVAAFLPTRLPADLLSKLKPVVLVSPSSSTDFEIKLTDLIGEGSNTKRKFKVVPELLRSTSRVYCIFGQDEELDVKKELKADALITIKELPGSHHYDKAKDQLLQTILTAIGI